MRRFQWIIATLFSVAFAQSAHADTFDLSQVTVFFGGIENPFALGINVGVVMMGPGTNIQAVESFGCTGAWCIPSPFGFAPGTSVFPNMGSLSLASFEVFPATVGETNFDPFEFVFFGLGVNTLGGPFILPQPGNSSTFV